MVKPIETLKQPRLSVQILHSERSSLTDDLTTTHFLSLTMDGSTDAGIVEQESVFARSEKWKKYIYNCKNLRFSKCFLSAIFYFVRLNCFISINLLIKFMFFSSANVFIWKLWLWFYSLAPTYSATFEEFLDNCSSHFEKYVFIDRYSKDGRVRSKFIGISSPDKPDADGILKALFVTLTRLGFDESTLKEKWWGLHATEHL